MINDFYYYSTDIQSILMIGNLSHIAKFKTKQLSRNLKNLDERNGTGDFALRTNETPKNDISVRALERISRSTPAHRRETCRYWGFRR